MKKIIAAIIIVIVSKCAIGQDVKKLIHQQDVERIIKTLSSDEMQGRSSLTPGIEKSASFIEKEFVLAGLIPMKGESTFRQHFNMTCILPGKSSITINEISVSADNFFIKSSDTLVNWNNDSSVLVVQITRDKGFRDQFTEYVRSGKNIVIIAGSSFAADFINYRDHYKKGETAFEGKDKQTLVCIFGTFGKVNNFQVSYQASSQQLPLFNIAGIIPGRSKPDEYVIYSAHYDHLGIIEPVNGDSIANGADDNASGTTAVIMLAKYFKHVNNNSRTLIFVAFTAEEIGEFGSQYFSHSIEADKVVAMFNIEMIGKLSKFGKNSAFITGYERSDFGTILQKNLKGTEFSFYPDPYPEQELFYRSDNATLAAMGVPAHTISTDQIDIDQLYHTVKDEFKSLDVANITSAIRAIALSSRSIVSGIDAPMRIPKLKTGKE